MEKISWSDELCIGIPEIDSDHQKIVELLNQLLSIPSTEYDSEMIDDILNELTSFESEHFNKEEQILEENGYRDLAEQKAEHRKFVKDTADICMEVIDRKREVSVHLLKHLHDLWLDHILDEVNTLRPFFKTT